MYQWRVTLRGANDNRSHIILDQGTSMIGAERFMHMVTHWHWTLLWWAFQVYQPILALPSLAELMDSLAEDDRSRLAVPAWSRFMSSLMLCFSAPGANTSLALAHAYSIPLRIIRRILYHFPPTMTTTVMAWRVPRQAGLASLPFKWRSQTFTYRSLCRRCEQEADLCFQMPTTRDTSDASAFFSTPGKASWD